MKLSSRVRQLVIQGICLLLLSYYTPAAHANHLPVNSYNADIIIYGGTSAAIMAAVQAKNEGDIGVAAPRPYGISYGAIVPKASECTNLLVPVVCPARISRLAPSEWNRCS